MSVSELQRRSLRITGTVQGVGFRPFVYRIATRLGLSGYVLNDSNGVLIEAEGPPAALDTLTQSLTKEAPALARVESVHTEYLKVLGEAEFEIRQSTDRGTASSPVSIDSSTCESCLSEVDNRSNRRYRYPFTNCTDCGPRYSIVKSIPYDRPVTTMADFKMCGACQREYDDPRDRRFHAQPNACPSCGPHLSLHDPTGAVLAERNDALVAAERVIASGGVVALKGIGGYHLVVDATNQSAVELLRSRKTRFDKPFAVMIPDLQCARSLAELTPKHLDSLTSVRRPITLVPLKKTARLSTAIAPGLVEIGIFLPYTPLHHLLLSDLGRPLVMTSGNMQDDPITFRDDDAFLLLRGLADVILSHNRPIHIRCDDSVVRTTARGTQMIRRARGYTPETLRLLRPTASQLIAVGAEMKNTVAVSKAGFVVTSQHIGDLDHPSTFQSFNLTIDHLCRLYGIHPELVVHDLHPEYLSTKFASELDLEQLPIQHHHSHIASCLLENGYGESVIGVAFDGLGFGNDGHLWGGEWLLADLNRSVRLAHLREARLPGGSTAIKEPWRMALSWLSQIYSNDEIAALAPGLDSRYKDVLYLIQKGSAPLTSSMGRLFDTVAALLGLRTHITYEGQAAIELEALASTANGTRTPHMRFAYEKINGLLVLDPVPMLCDLIEAQDRGVPKAVLALGFHLSLASITVEITAELARQHNLDTAALSGGVFQNTLLSDAITKGLEGLGLRVLTHSLLPPNDGGISAGQAAIAAWRSSA